MVGYLLFSAFKSRNISMGSTSSLRELSGLSAAGVQISLDLDASAMEILPSLPPLLPPPFHAIISPVMSIHSHSLLPAVYCQLLTVLCLLSPLPALSSLPTAHRPLSTPSPSPLRTPHSILPTPFPSSSSTPPTAHSPLPTDSSSSFDRYSVILTRMPFGDEKAAAALAAATAVANQPPVESFTKNLKMCAITRNHFNGKVQVGIVNTTTKKNYFLYEGDAEDGMELVQADFEKEKALLRKDGEEVWMDMTSATAAAPVLTRGPRGMQAIPPPQNASPVYPAAVNNSPGGPADNNSGAPKSIAAEIQRKLGQRQTDRTAPPREGSGMMPPGMAIDPALATKSATTAASAQNATVPAETAVSSVSPAIARRTAAGIQVASSISAPPPVAPQADPSAPDKNVRVVDHTKGVPKLSAADLQQKLQDYQMELIRSGGQLGPPLPMELTPAMDAQLVNEGVLPPVAQ